MKKLLLYSLIFYSFSTTLNSQSGKEFCAQAASQKTYQEKAGYNLKAVAQCWAKSMIKEAQLLKAFYLSGNKNLVESLSQELIDLYEQCNDLEEKTNE